MRVHFNAFWKGFLERTDQNHVGFFLDLLEKTLGRECIIDSKEKADILVESGFGPSLTKTRPWKMKIMFTGEPWERDNVDDQDALIGTQGNDKSVHCPLFVSQTQCSHPAAHTVFPPLLKVRVPPISAVCVVISNPQGKDRNRCLDRLHQANIPVFYAGKFRNNGAPLSYPQGSSTFINYLKQFRFVACLENTSQDHQITEKIFHGFLAGTVPIYFGSKRITEYFSAERFVNIANPEDNDWIEQIQELMMDDEAYERMCLAPVQKNGESCITIDTVAENLKKSLAYYLKNIHEMYQI